MQQSNVIFGNLLGAYLIFITLRGELPNYITLLRGGGPQAGGTSNASASATANAVVSGANQLLNDNPFNESLVPASNSVSPSQAPGILGVFGP